MHLPNGFMTGYRRKPADPLDMLKRMKFEPVGFHPTEDRPLNVVEQINQTRTYSVAATAARQLLELHPEAGGFHLAPGAHASLELDIMSHVPGLVGAETFAAVDPRNNRKLQLDLDKMAARTETFRYVFFMSPRYPTSERQSALEKHGVQCGHWNSKEQTCPKHNEGGHSASLLPVVIGVGEHM
ncbi:hypothetical protein N8D56_17355 [Devosia sp. A8/3-2]|nr:hypothetical protein N8D56_17355 [Devosia sp. A8/3-2]